jgi:hypothetical protein
MRICLQVVLAFWVIVIRYAIMLCSSVCLNEARCHSSWVMWVIFIIKFCSFLHTVSTVRGPFVPYNEFLISIFEWETLKEKVMSQSKDYDKLTQILDGSYFPFFEINLFCKVFNLKDWDEIILLWPYGFQFTLLLHQLCLKGMHCYRASWFAPNSSAIVCGLWDCRCSELNVMVEASCGYRL